MNVVDSSAWLAYFSDEPNAEFFQKPIADKERLVVPVITIYEVYKVFLREYGENHALQAVTAMQRGMVRDLNTSLAMVASRLSIQYSIPMADSIILATAEAYKAVVWTQDSHFEKIPGIKYFKKN